MFESLTNRLQQVFKNLSRQAKLSEADVDASLREVRLALLEADVNYQVVKEFLARVRERAIGAEVSKALNPSQQMVKIIHEELIRELGEPGKLNLTGQLPRAILMVGLQGSGKTTTTAKLARILRAKGERVWMVAADTYRPAAIQQLKILAEEIDVPFFSQDNENPVKVCEKGFESAARGGASVVLMDTAGRSQIDPAMMEELAAIHTRIQPVEILLVADAMTGQEAVNIAAGFKERIPLTGLILTKMDGDARGGAAISMRSVTGVPIKYIGTGEARDALELFAPDRLASRILGMGDVLSLIEKAEATIDQEAAAESAERMLKGEFTLEDFAQQLQQVRKMGPFSKILDMLPGGMAPAREQIDSEAAEKQMVHTLAIIQSMTLKERRNPRILNGGRKRRIAAGSGTSVQQVNQLINQYRQMKKLLGTIGKRGTGLSIPGLR
ncbi:MAG: signal recognition particle protein [Anaerolineales bacterium]|nr:signal recognition particle protein [Anaerolineales bacterium]